MDEGDDGLKFEEEGVNDDREDEVDTFLGECRENDGEDNVVDEEDGGNE